MAAVTVRLPGLLSRFTNGERHVTLVAETIDECFDQLLEVVPELEPHLFDGHDVLRAHLRVFHNGDPIDLETDGAIRLEDGDSVTVLQAVSGG
jgi:molybdopterin converting factor small subunit